MSYPSQLVTGAPATAAANVPGILASAIADEAGLKDAEVVIDSDRHMSLQVAAQA